MEFYGSVVGWTTQEFEGGKPYSMWCSAHSPVGGVAQLPEPAKAMGAAPHWMGNIAVDDVDASRARVVELGGKALSDPMPIPGVGRLAPCMDPHGAVFALVQCDGEAPGHAGAVRVGEVGWSELSSDSWTESWAFYSALLGWTQSQDMDMGPMGTYRMWRCGRDTGEGGMMNRPPGTPASAWLYYFTVASLEAALDAVRAGGGQVVNGPMDVPGGDRVAACIDPQGAGFALHECGPGDS